MKQPLIRIVQLFSWLKSTFRLMVYQNQNHSDIWHYSFCRSHYSCIDSCNSFRSEGEQDSGKLLRICINTVIVVNIYSVIYIHKNIYIYIVWWVARKSRWLLQNYSSPPDLMLFRTWSLISVFRWPFIILLIVCRNDVIFFVTIKKNTA